MAGTKETPRQRMISMMYLVLTALLALNVSKEVIEAFVVVNESAELTNENFDRKLKNSYSIFEKMYALNQNEVRPFWEKAKEVKSLSIEMVNYIEDLRTELICKSEGIPEDSARIIPMWKLKKKDNYSISNEIFIGNTTDGTKSKGIELRERIDEFRSKMMQMVGPQYSNTLNLGLVTDSAYYDADGKKQSWEMHYFYNTIQVANITILNKMITEVYSAEFDVINTLMNAIGADDYKYDKIDARVLPKSNYVLSGDSYSAEIIVAAYDTSQSPMVYFMQGTDSLKESQLDQAKLLESKSGKINLNLPAHSVGVKNYAGIVCVKNSKGETNHYHFNNEYVVERPSLTVSATNMNVLYIGVNNPVSISVPGIAREKIVCSISCGTLHPNPNNDEWIVNVPSGDKEAVIKVKAYLQGNLRNIGHKIFRVKQLPTPTALIANKNEGFINKDILIAAGAITPKMPIDFEFDYSFKVISFRMTIQRGFNMYQFTSDSDALTKEMIKQIKMTNRGMKILFDNIVALGPDGSERSLSPIILSIN